MDGTPRIVADPPLVVPVDDLVPADADRARLQAELAALIARCRRALGTDRRYLLEQFELVDIARKVVGVGSVGTRCWIVLMLGRDSSNPLFLQVKEAGPSVLEDFAGASKYGNEGQRVVAGQRLMQAASDIFLGWQRSRLEPGGVPYDFDIRQLRDWKASADIGTMAPAAMRAYGQLCGWILARAHARSGDRIAIAAYLGRSAVFDQAIGGFAADYADQNERDYGSLAAASKAGRVIAEQGRLRAAPSHLGGPRRGAVAAPIPAVRPRPTRETIYLSTHAADMAHGGDSPIRSSGPPASPREGAEDELMRRGWRAAGRLRRAVLFVNPRSGGGAAARSGVVERAREQGIEVHILSLDQSLAALAEAAVASGADALGMAGGDGSLAVVAAAAAAHDLPFVCVPAGTRNHFALDIGVDRHDVAGALDAFNEEVERRIDMAEVNGRLFLNNVSLGIYGDAVQRSAYRDAKVRTLLETAQEVLSSGARGAGSGSDRRCRARAPAAGCGARFEQSLCAGSARCSWHPPGARLRQARNSSARRTGRSAASPGASLDRGISGGGRAGNGARRHRRGSSRAERAVAIRHKARLAARPHLPPPPRRVTISAVGGGEACAYVGSTVALAGATIPLGPSEAG